MPTHFLENGRLTPLPVAKFLDNINPADFEIVHKGKRISYYNVSCAFDIETTSTFRTCGKPLEYCLNECKNNYKTCPSCIKFATMYIWQLGIDNLVTYGRTWDEFVNLMDAIADKFMLDDKLHLLIYVHNLSFEFQFIRKLFNWVKVFALDEREPLQCITADGLEFRCSYKLSGYSLAKLGDQLQKYQVKKAVGDLDYNKVRGWWTPLTDEELNYCIQDIRVVMAYIQEKIERGENIAKIPLTKTGYVRRYCRENCFEDKRYRYNIGRLKLQPEEFHQLRAAFQGGYTHANAIYSGLEIENVHSYDETSAYPYVMVSERFPMSCGQFIDTIDIDTYNELSKIYCCVFDVALYNLHNKYLIDDYISQSHCRKLVNPQLNNGRVVSAEYIEMTLTEIDLDIITRYYSFDDIKISNVYLYKREYLPTPFVEAILNLYQTKTILKGVKGKEVEYLQGKENLNSSYGMMVTNIVRPEIVYDNGWAGAIIPHVRKAIEAYNKDRSRFLFYPWGVYVTAYARRNLWLAIGEYGDDYIYSDTDSVKGVNREAHLPFIEAYNKQCYNKLKLAMDWHGLDIELTSPLDIKGLPHPLGTWTYEGEYTRFKTLGAKRYMTLDAEDGLNITVSGLNKKSAVPWLLQNFGVDGAFRHFAEGLTVPEDSTGKLTHTYIDDETEADITDYMGVTGHCHELSSVHLWKQDYNLSLAENYLMYIRGFRQNGN